MSVSSSSSSPVRIAIVGGGLTGLAAAHRLRELAGESGQAVEITLFEADSRLGGVFGSQQVGEFLIERGADSFITNKPAGLGLAKRLNLEGRMISTDARYRRSLVLYRGKPVPTPDGFQLMAPTETWPILKTPLLSLEGKLQLLAERFIPRRIANSDESLAEFARRRFGEEAFVRLIQPMVGGIYTSDPETLSLRATLPRFLEMEHRYGSVIRGLKEQSASNAGQAEEREASGARYGLFASFQNGMQELLDALEARVSQSSHIHTSTPVSGLVRSASSEEWIVQREDGTQEPFDRVLLSLPSGKTAELLSKVSPKAASALSSIGAASSAIVVSAHRLEDFTHPLDAFGLVIPHIEGRRILAVSFLSRKFPGRAPDGSVVLRTFVGGALQPGEYERSDAEIVTTVLAELNSIFGCSRDPQFAEVCRYPQGMPQYTLGHLNRVATIRREANRLTGLALAGNYLTGVGIPDCIQSGEQAAESLWSGGSWGNSGLQSGQEGAEGISVPGLGNGSRDA